MDAPNTFLFTAYFDDGTQYEQGVNDASLQEPGKNAFFDILHKPIKPIAMLYAFRITEIGGERRTLAVDLRTGAFEINGVFFFQHKEPLRDFRLIYFRAVLQHRTQKSNLITGEASTVDSCDVGYIVGWQTNDAKGKNVERIVRI